MIKPYCSWPKTYIIFCYHFYFDTGRHLSICVIFHQNLMSVKNQILVSSVIRYLLPVYRKFELHVHYMCQGSIIKFATSYFFIPNLMHFQNLILVLLNTNLGHWVLIMNVEHLDYTSRHLLITNYYFSKRNIWSSDLKKKKKEELSPILCNYIW